tara:strand:- start:165 stop:413 length:249 start_codon:yes stop_codon:yes gene_type:complete
MMIKIKDKCENCHQKAKKAFRIVEPGVTYRINSSNERTHLAFTFCTASCAKAFAAWMFGAGLSKLPPGWTVEEIKEVLGPCK